MEASKVLGPERKAGMWRVDGYNHTLLELKRPLEISLCKALNVFVNPKELK